MDENFKVFAEACRENTGRNFMDSGDYYGRHFEKPAISQEDPEVTIDKDCGATISVAHFLHRRYDVDEDLMEQFAETEMDEADFMEAQGYVQAARDNTYNGENDFSQDFIWTVWVPVEFHGDWIHTGNFDEQVVTIRIHTGCDIRGGYAAPIFCRASGDYTAPVDCSADWGITEAIIDGERVTDDLYELTDTWDSGYSSYTFGEVDNSVKRWFGFTATPESIVAQLHTGEIVKLAAMIPYGGE